MGKTLLIFKINAADMQKLDATIEAIKKVQSGEFKDAKQEPIGFGVAVIKAAFTVPEKDDKAVEQLTKELNELEQVEEAELQEMTLV